MRQPMIGQGIKSDSKLYRVKTGTFTGAEYAKEGANKIKTAKLSQVANVVAAQ